MQGRGREEYALAEAARVLAWEELIEHLNARDVFYPFEQWPTRLKKTFMTPHRRYYERFELALFFLRNGMSPIDVPGFVLAVAPTKAGRLALGQDENGDEYGRGPVREVQDVILRYRTGHLTGRSRASPDLLRGGLYTYTDETGRLWAKNFEDRTGGQDKLLVG